MWYLSFFQISEVSNGKKECPPIVSSPYSSSPYTGPLWIVFPFLNHFVVNDRMKRLPSFFPYAKGISKEGIIWLRWKWSSEWWEILTKLRSGYNQGRNILKCHTLSIKAKISPTNLIKSGSTCVDPLWPQRLSIAGMVNLFGLGSCIAEVYDR